MVDNIETQEDATFRTIKNFNSSSAKGTSTQTNGAIIRGTPTAGTNSGNESYSPNGRTPTTVIDSRVDTIIPGRRTSTSTIESRGDPVISGRRTSTSTLESRSDPVIPGRRTPPTALDSRRDPDIPDSVPSSEGGVPARGESWLTDLHTVDIHYANDELDGDVPEPSNTATIWQKYTAKYHSDIETEERVKIVFNCSVFAAIILLVIIVALTVNPQMA